MDFNSYLQTNAQKINEELGLILSEFLNQTKKTNIKLLPLAQEFLNSCKGGKRIRGVLCKLGYEFGKVHLGGVPARGGATIRGEKEILKIGAAYEILHAALLIHDDIMDKSTLRRGQPTLYKALGGDHKAISQAISVGDIGFYLPIKIITDSNFLAEYKLKALSCLSQIIINTGWGQVMDIEGEDKEFVNTYKTAKYTIAGPLQIGAILAGAEEELIRVLGEFGENLGIAFQIQDDILDGESEAVDVAEKKALQYITQAKSLIPRLTDDEKIAKLLEQMADYMVERDK